MEIVFPVRTCGPDRIVRKIVRKIVRNSKPVKIAVCSEDVWAASD